MARPSRRVRQLLPLPESRWEDGVDNGADGIDWDTGDYQDPGTGSSLTVEESDSSPSVSPVDTIIFDSADFTVTDNADGSVTIQSIGGGGPVTLPWFWVDDYGAVGDDSTDDTAAIEAAIAAAIANDGGVVLFGPKTYKITSTLTLDGTAAQMHLWGTGNEYGPSVIHQATANTTAIEWTSSWADASRTFQGTVRDLIVKGASSATTTVRGIYAKSNVNLDNVGVQGFYDGIMLDDVSFYSRIRGCFITGSSGSGIRLNETNNITIDTCRITGDPLGVTSIDAVVTGIRITATSPRGINHRIKNSSIEYFTGTGIYVDGGYATEIEGNYFETQQSSSGNAHIKIGPGGSNVCYTTRIESNYLQGDGTSGFNAIDLGRANGVLIGNNFFGLNAAIGITSTANTSNVLLWNNRNSPAGTFSLPASTYTLDPAAPPMTNGDAAGGDLSGTYPNPTVVDDSHSHTSSTLPTTSGGEILISDTPSTPLIFADLIQTEAQDDLVYSD